MTFLSNLPHDLSFLSKPDTWRGFAPALHVDEPHFCSNLVPLAFPPQDLRDAKAQLLREGYLHLPPPSWDLSIGDIAGAIRTLHANNLPPVFAFHYDEVWMLMARLRPLIGAMLGDDYAMLPEFWAWHVDPNTEEAGWPPHRDKGMRSLRPDGSPMSLTVWLPLTEATPLNGCMYVVPADRDPTYNTIAEGQLQFRLTDIRALPAKAGTITAWNQAIIHWGAHAARRDETPRISLSCEFQRADEQPFASPLFSPHVVPTFAARQKLIARQLPRFQHMVPLNPAMEAWVHEILGNDV